MNTRFQARVKWELSERRKFLLGGREDSGRYGRLEQEVSGATAWCVKVNRDYES